MTTPEKITKLGPNEIFVFGSNLAGRHGKGAAKAALAFGAKYGIGEGPSGQTYALPTKDEWLRTLPLNRISYYIVKFKNYAWDNQNLTFLLTPVGCGLAGLHPSEIAHYFGGVTSNVILPDCFLPYVGDR